MLSHNAHEGSDSLKSGSDSPKATLIFLDERRQQFKEALTPEQRFANHSSELEGLDPGLVRSLAAHYTFLNQSPDPQFVAHARFSKNTEEQDAELIDL